MSSNRILVIEDETKLREHLTKVFVDEGYSVATCSSVFELEELLTLPTKAFDVITLDRLLNGRDSAPLVPKIKAQILGSKIIVVSAINSAAEKAAILDLGADDYLAKPFSSRELVARVRVLLRRSISTLRLGNLVLNLEDRKLLIDDKEMPITNKEFLFLKTLIQSPGKVFSKNVLYENVWEMSADVESNVVEATVNKLRRRFEELGASAEIKNSRNVGYWIEE